MGYRIYMKIVPKEEVKKLRNCKTKVDLLKLYKRELEEDEYVGVYEMFEGAADYEFGKYIEWTTEQLNRFGLNIFLTEELSKMYEEDDLYEITEDGLAFIIATYHKDIAKYYKGMYDEIKDSVEDNSISIKDIKSSLGEVLNHFSSMVREWGNNGLSSSPYSMRKKDEELVSSGKYEYGIFELVRLYKKINTKTESIIIYGY